MEEDFLAPIHVLTVLHCSLFNTLKLDLSAEPKQFLICLDCAWIVQETPIIQDRPNACFIKLKCNIGICIPFGFRHIFLFINTHFFIFSASTSINTRLKSWLILMDNLSSINISLKKIILKLLSLITIFTAVFIKKFLI